MDYDEANDLMRRRIDKAQRHGRPWRTSSGKWRAHSIAGDPNSPIVDVPAPGAGQPQSEASRMASGELNPEEMARYRRQAKAERKKKQQARGKEFHTEESSRMATGELSPEEMRRHRRWRESEGRA